MGEASLQSLLSQVVTSEARCTHSCYVQCLQILRNARKMLPASTQLCVSCVNLKDGVLATARLSHKSSPPPSHLSLLARTFLHLLNFKSGASSNYRNLSMVGGRRWDIHFATRELCVFYLETPAPAAWHKKIFSRLFETAFFFRHFWIFNCNYT